MQKLILNYPGPCIFYKRNIFYSREWIFENYSNFDLDWEL